jgi:hypothetical protein
MCIWTFTIVTDCTSPVLGKQSAVILRCTKIFEKKYQDFSAPEDKSSQLTKCHVCVISDSDRSPDTRQ